MDENLYDGYGNLLGIRQRKGDEVYLYDTHGALKGIYNARTDQTFDPHGNFVGVGDLLTTLL